MDHRRRIMTRLVILMGMATLLYHMLSYMGMVSVGERGNHAIAGDTTTGLPDAAHRDLPTSHDLTDAYVINALRQISRGREANCHPRHNIMYLKTHKCASSTLQNILLRYAKIHTQHHHARDGGELNGPALSSEGVGQTPSGNSSSRRPLGTESDALPIIVAVPPDGVYFGHPQKFKASMLMKSPWLLPPQGRVNVFASHSRLDVREMRKVLHPDALWITIVRHPVQQYRSLFAYTKMSNVVKAPFETFLTRPLAEMRQAGRRVNRVGFNQMAFDLGFGPDTFHNDSQIDSMIKEVEAVFDLVLLTERMDESLVLLGHALCWHLEDLVSLKKNARASQEDGLTDEGKMKIEKLNHVDMRLYQHFSQKFELLTEAYGKNRLKDEVSALQRKRMQFEDYCVLETVKGHDSKATVREYSGDVLGFRLRHPENETCLALAWNAKQFFSHFRNFQKQLFDSRDH